MKRTSVLVALVLFLFVAASPASAQLMAAKDGPIVYGHHHVAASDIAAHKKFWADTLGGTVGKFGRQRRDRQVPERADLLQRQKPTGGTKGTTANHIGFSVPNLRAVVDKVKANGYKMITSTEVAADQKVVDDIAPVNADERRSRSRSARRCEGRVASRTSSRPSRSCCTTFTSSGSRTPRCGVVRQSRSAPSHATPPNFLAADLPGVALNFSPSPTPVVGHEGPRGRSHRVRSEESRGVLQEARGDGHQARHALSQGAGTSASRSRSSPIRGARLSS